MKFKALWILLTFLPVTIGVLQGQSVSERSATTCLEQYFNILEGLHELNLNGKEGELNVEQFCELLESGSSETSPWPMLYEDCPRSPLLRFQSFPDCTKPEFERPLAEFLYNYTLGKEKFNVPILRSSCVISSSNSEVTLRYQAEGDVLVTQCMSDDNPRVAVVRFDNEVAFIHQIRWATKAEIVAECHSNTTQHEPVAQGEGPCCDKVNRLENQVAVLTGEVATLAITKAGSAKELNKKSAEIVTLRRKLESVAFEVQMLKDSLKTVNSKNASLNRRIERIEAAVEKSEKNLEKQQKEWDDARVIVMREMQSLSNELSSYSRKKESDIAKLEKYLYTKTLFLGINYNLLQAPYTSPDVDKLSEDPIKRSFNKDDVSSNFGINAYVYPVGGYISNVRINTNDAPELHYTTIYADKLKETLFLDGVEFTDLEYEYSGHNFNTVDFGVNIYTKLEERPIISGFYVKAGLSIINGYVWDYYSGDYGEFLERDPETDLYVIDKKKISNSGFSVGLAYVKPYFQIEVGYNQLYKDFYINIGANFPFSIRDDKTGGKMGKDEPKVEKMKGRIQKAMRSMPN